MVCKVSCFHESFSWNLSHEHLSSWNYTRWLSWKNIFSQMAGCTCWQSEKFYRGLSYPYGPQILTISSNSLFLFWPKWLSFWETRVCIPSQCSCDWDYITMDSTPCSRAKCTTYQVLFNIEQDKIDTLLLRSWCVIRYSISSADSLSLLSSPALNVTPPLSYSHRPELFDLL